MHPQMEITFGGKHVQREAEKVDVEEFIAKKGLQAKGKKVSQYEVASARFIEPLHKPEDDIVQQDLQADALENAGTPQPDNGDDSLPTLF